MYSKLVLDKNGYVTGGGNKVTDGPWELLRDVSKYVSYFWLLNHTKWVQGLVQDYDGDTDYNFFTGYPVNITYSKGSTEKLWIASENRSAHPANGKSGNTWYVRQ